MHYPIQNILLSSFVKSSSTWGILDSPEKSILKTFRRG
eukprot:UN07450